MCASFCGSPAAGLASCPAYLEPELNRRPVRPGGGRGNQVVGANPRFAVARTLSARARQLPRKRDGREARKTDGIESGSRAPWRAAILLAATVAPLIPASAPARRATPSATLTERDRAAATSPGSSATCRAPASAPASDGHFGRADLGAPCARGSARPTGAARGRARLARRAAARRGPGGAERLVAAGRVRGPAATGAAPGQPDLQGRHRPRSPARPSRPPRPARGEGRDRRGQPDRRQAVQVRRRPPQLEDSGYDCSGAVSYALHGADLLKTPESSGLGRWGLWRPRRVDLRLRQLRSRLRGHRRPAPGHVEGGSNGGRGPRWRESSALVGRLHRAAPGRVLEDLRGSRRPGRAPQLRPPAFAAGRSPIQSCVPGPSRVGAIVGIGQRAAVGATGSRSRCRW